MDYELLDMALIPCLFTPGSLSAQECYRKENLRLFRYLLERLEASTRFGKVQASIWAVEKGLSHECMPLLDPMIKGRKPGGW